MWIWIAFGALATVVAVVLITSYVCFRMAFFVSDKEKASEIPFPNDDVYGPFLPLLAEWRKEADEIPFEEVQITSFDGLTLYGKYYEQAKNLPIEIMMHGYRGTAERDLCGGVQRCFLSGRNALVVSHRASGKSGGNVLSFGINESKDCLRWVDFLIEKFGSDVKILLTGISMGAATALIAAGMELPKNVVGVIADCGYNSARDIIKKTIREMRLPSGLLYPFVKLGARLYGKFDLEESSPETAVKNCKIPVFFIHGEADDFVPCEMSKINYEACGSKKRLYIVKGAGHGLGYPVEREGYVNALKEFFGGD